MSAEPFPDAAHLVGTWRLRALERLHPDGEIERPYGPEPRGFLTLTADNWLHVCFAKTPLPWPSQGEVRPPTLEERAAAYDGLLAFCGRYELWADYLCYRVEISSSPGRVGRFVRRFRAQGDELELVTPVVERRGIPMQSIIRYERAVAPPPGLANGLPAIEWPRAQPR